LDERVNRLSGFFAGERGAHAGIGVQAVTAAPPSRQVVVEERAHCLGRRPATVPAQILGRIQTIKITRRAQKNSNLRPPEADGVWRDSAAELVSGAVITVEDDSMRIRLLPIG
jgi:hypothetical protein